jgi:conjugal transfer/entry exclusion protein
MKAESAIFAALAENVKKNSQDMVNAIKFREKTTRKTCVTVLTGIRKNISHNRQALARHMAELKTVNTDITRNISNNRQALARYMAELNSVTRHLAVDADQKTMEAYQRKMEADQEKMEADQRKMEADQETMEETLNALKYVIAFSLVDTVNYLGHVTARIESGKW